MENSPISDDLVEDLVELDYDGRQLTFLPTFFSSFHNGNVQRLLLSNNSLVSIPDQTLTDFANLISLYLTNNRLREIDRELSEIGTLRVLSLGGNLIRTVKNDAFLKLRNLRILKLSDNNLDVIEPFGLSPLINLTHLYLKRCNLGLLKPPIFAHNIHLKQLYLNESNLEIGNELFRPLRKLQKLNLSFNGLDALRTDTFQGLVCLKILNLKGNRIRHLKKDLLSDCLRLRRLDVSENCVREIDADFFLGLRSLRNLLLHGCHPTLKVTDSKMFAYNESLIFLTLSYCENFPIETIGSLKWFYFDSRNVPALITTPFDWAWGGPNFTILQITDSFLSWPELKTIFERCSSLMRLNLSDSVLSEPFENNTFASLARLQVLILDRIQIYELNAPLFDETNDLRTLSMKSCDIFAIDSQAFRHLKKLHSLCLAGNLLAKRLDSDVFKHLKHLRHLDLSNCQIDSLPNEIFGCNLRLKCLRFEHNCLPKLSLDLFANCGRFERLTHWNLMKIEGSHTNDSIIFEPIAFDFAN